MTANCQHETTEIVSDPHEVTLGIGEDGSPITHEEDDPFVRCVTCGNILQDHIVEDEK